MCGIFALIECIKDHHFNFNIFKDYLNSPFIEKRQELLLQLLNENQLPNAIREIEINLNVINDVLKFRGPDYQNLIEIKQPYYKLLYHSLLHMRGEQDHFIKQPLVNNQFVLQYNGEIYNIQIEQSDTVFLMNNFSTFNNDLQKVQSFLQTLNGDYSFIFHDMDKQIITICKDPFGKKSLLLGFTKKGFVISSQVIGEQKIEDQQELDDEDDDGKTVDEKYLQRKYLNEFNQCINKSCIEIPNNCIIQIDLSKQKIEWTQMNIIDNIQNLFQYKQIPQPINIIVERTYELLIKSTKEIIQNIFGFQKHFLGIESEDRGKIGVLFSGGIDCSLIVHILCQLLPKGSQIDLINVAFTNDAPDRVTGIASHLELQEKHKEINLNLILIDKTLDDIYKDEKKFLQTLYPKVTHMDFNIGMILKIGSSYSNITRVLLSGLGADEIFSGYARYRHALKRGGEDLLEEMNFDILRLWIRNLGRDDRVVSSTSKELRFPFLNLELISYVRQNSDPMMYQQGSTKSILRMICQKEQLNVISQHQKKAIQFGTKLAKLSNKRFFGGNKRAKGTFNYQI